MFVDGGCIVEVQVGRLELAHDQVRVHSHGVGVGHIDACRLLALHVRTYVDIRRMSFTIRSEAADAAVIVLMCTLVQVSATRGKLLRK